MINLSSPGPWFRGCLEGKLAPPSPWGPFKEKNVVCMNVCLNYFPTPAPWASSGRLLYIETHLDDCTERLYLGFYHRFGFITAGSESREQVTRSIWL